MPPSRNCQWARKANQVWSYQAAPRHSPPPRSKCRFTVETQRTRRKCGRNVATDDTNETNRPRWTNSFFFVGTLSLRGEKSYAAVGHGRSNSVRRKAQPMTLPLVVRVQ